MAAADPEQIAWDLTDVLPSREGPALEKVLDELEAEVEALEARREDLEDVEEPSEVASLFDRLGSIHELRSRLLSYGRLSFSTDTGDGEVRAFMNRMDAVSTDAANRTRFLELWWIQLGDDRAEALLPDDPDLRYLLEHLRDFSPYALSEEEERVISLKDDTGATAVNRLRDIVTSGFRFEDPVTGETASQGGIKRRVYHPDAEVREAAYDELWRVYGEHEDELTFLYQTVVRDWANEQITLRGYDDPIERRHHDSHVTAETVDALLDVCRDRNGLFQRYFQWKGDQLGLDPMSRYHIYAPLDADPPEIAYPEARDRVLDTLEGFSPEVADAARQVFEEDHLHVYPQEDKRSGAYCSTPTRDTTPYVFLNYVGDASSAKTLAHELGHAVHSVLASDRHPLVSRAPLPLAETASVFSEMLLHDELRAEADPEAERALLSDKIHEIWSTVQRQAYITIFEREAHQALDEGATPDDLHGIYMDLLEEQFGPLEIPDAFRREWTYIPHVYHTPFYCYSYSFGNLVTLALYDLYRERGEDFVTDYLELLSLGGSASPRDAVQETVGLDLSQRAFWERSFRVVERLVDELEAL